LSSLASDAATDLATAAPAREGSIRSLRWRLFVLSAGALLPLLLAATGAQLYMVHERGQAAQDTALVTARAVAAALQAEVESVSQILQVLSGAEALVDGRLPDFETRMRGVAEARGWRTATLASPAGELLFSTSGFSAPNPRPIDPSSLQAAIERRAVVVGKLAEGNGKRGPAFPVRLPVIRDGEVRHVLSAVLPAEHVLELVRRQNLPANHVVAIFDPAGARVARSVEHSERRASPTLQALIERNPREGVGLTRTLEGRDVHTAVHRVPGMDWVVAIGIPASEVRRTLVASLAAGLLGLVASLGVSAWLAWILSGKVRRPIAHLTAAAAALGRGERVAHQPLEIEELDLVGRALVDASRERDRATRERLAAEAERERLLARATEALKSAQDAARTKDEFLAVLGHELRNPLAPISSAMHLMAMKGDDATRPERRIVERQLAHMKRLVDDLLDVSRITGRKLEIRRAPMRVGPWVEQAVDGLRGVVGRRRLAVDLPPDAAQSWVEGDAVRLAQVLGNLLGNAIKFTGEDATISVQARREGEQVAVTVADDGMGMQDEDLRRVFDLFYQAPQSQHRPSAGLGLGLPIVRSLVEMHGGTVEAHSDGPGQGSRFTVRLPRVEAPADATGGAAPATEQFSGSGRVLVVDDNHDAADTAGALLEASGFTARVCYAPDEALAALADFMPDVAVLDIGLPGMDGYALAAAIRARPGGRSVRLVALTGYGQDSDVARARNHGFEAHMTKPVEPDALLALVGRLARPDAS
jgi:signal transduction histidine kinase/ActR/RegA family two-component response regulator